MRFIIECVWSGYYSSGERVCHRMVTKHPKAWEGLTSIRFTDGTYMSVHIRPAKFRERVKEIHGYDSLFNKLKYSELCKKGIVGVMEVY